MSTNARRNSELCPDCPVKEQCLKDALVHDELGVWGGLTKSERNIVFSQIGVQAVHQAIDEGWFQPDRLPEHSYIKVIAERYRNRKVTPLIPRQTVVVTEIVRTTFLFDFEQLDAEPTVEAALRLMEEQLREAPHPTVLLETTLVDSSEFRFDFEML